MTKNTASTHLVQRMLLLPIVLLAFSSCTNDSEKAPVREEQVATFPEPMDLSTLKKSVFIPTPEHKLPKDKNAIYCSTLLYAWDEIREEIAQPFTIDNSSADLTLLNSSKSHLHTMRKGEYAVEAVVTGESISVKAAFSQSLPFEHVLRSFPDKLTFDGVPVFAFGQIGYDVGAENVIQILYYKDDENFAIKLSPRNKEHEIILHKSAKSFSTMRETISAMKSVVEAGAKERQDKNKLWRYQLNLEDELLIPKFRFNLEHNYPTLVNGRLTTSARVFTIQQASQQIAFVLDEDGATIESVAGFGVMSAPLLSEEKPTPKKMRFDSPFLLVLRRTDSEHPYFGMWVNNAELMQTADDDSK